MLLPEELEIPSDFIENKTDNVIFVKEIIQSNG